MDRPSKTEPLKSEEGEGGQERGGGISYLINKTTEQVCSIDVKDNDTDGY